MEFPNVLALPLEEAECILQEQKIQYDVQLTLPPREDASEYALQHVRKYVVRQQVLSDDKLVLTIVYR